MIFVTVGSGPFPFDRLMRAVDAIHIAEEIVVQHGSATHVPTEARSFAYVAVEELRRYLDSARVVVAHAGVGTILYANMAGHKPYVVPRRKQFGETVDDHQVEFANRLAALGVVHVVEDERELRDLVTVPDGTRTITATAGKALEAEVSRYLASVLRRRHT